MRKNYQSMEQKSFSKLSSDTISALRFPLMVGIVFIHFGVLKGITVQGVEYGANPPLWLVYVNNLFSQVLPRIGVPLFFLMSGYLFFLSGLTADSYKSKLKKRARTLLVPYILWNAIFILYYAMRSLPALHSLFPNASPGNWSVLTVLGCFYNSKLGVFFDPSQPQTDFNIYPQCVPMWYVRDLMLVMILAPLFHWLIKKAGWRAVVALGVVWFFVWADKPLGYIRQLADASFFFSWGACLAIRGTDFTTSMRRFRPALWLYPIVAVADLLTKDLACNPYLHNAGIVIGIFAAVQLAATLLERGKVRVNKFLAGASFFIFALHTLFIGNLAKVFVKVCFIDSPYYMCLLYFAVPITTIAVCLALYWPLRRCAPKLCVLLTGGR